MGPTEGGRGGMGGDLITSVWPEGRETKECIKSCLCNDISAGKVKEEKEGGVGGGDRVLEAQELPDQAGEGVGGQPPGQEKDGSSSSAVGRQVAGAV